MKNRLQKLTSPLLRLKDRTFKPRDWLMLTSLVLAFGTLAVAVLSIEKADWVRPEPLLIVTLAFALVCGSLLANLRFINKWFIPLMVISGLGVTVWQSVLIFKANQDYSAFQQWWLTVSNALPSDAPIYFVMFLFFITWVIGVLSFWFLWKRRTGWVTVMLGAVMLLTNVSNLPHEKYYYFPLFFLLAIPLLVCTHLIKQTGQTAVWQDNTLRRNLFTYSTIILLITVLITGVAYALPEPPLDKIGVKIDTGNLNLYNKWFNVFSTISSKWPQLRNRDKTNLLFKDGIETGDDILFIINSPHSNYWGVRRYDIYQSNGWSSATNSQSSDLITEIINYVNNPAIQTESVTYTVENRLKTDILLTDGQTTSVSIPFEIQVFSNPLSSPRPVGAIDPASIVSLNLMLPYQKYTVVTKTVTASPADLLKAGTDYPLWITSQYLQLPSDFPLRVSALSLDITRDAATPYEKALAIKKYLNQFVYDQNATPPPANKDGVDYFLFSSKNGYCTHFASAMTTMLRATGVPARFCTGYLRGEYDRATDTYQIRGRNYHAWVEIFFPDMGWVEFESTPANATAVPEETPEAVTEPTYAFTEEDSLPPWMLDITGGAAGQRPPVNINRKIPSIWAWLIGIISVFFLALIIVRSILNRWVRRLIAVDSPAEIYTQMRLLSKRGSIALQDWETPAEFGRRLAKSIPWQEAAIRQITDSYTTSTYAREKILDKRENGKLGKAWVSLCPSLIRHMLQLRKWMWLRLFWKPS
ncbi:MAG: transglutaminase domain-containing protein [Dehalococcoidales bacterium]|nr:transglutaminase domain-containing protein [Dehalococcoidales bacterium]